MPSRESPSLEEGLKTACRSAEDALNSMAEGEFARERVQPATMMRASTSNESSP